MTVVHGILQARILEWAAYPFSKQSSQPRNRTAVSCIAGEFLTNWAMGENINPLVVITSAALPPIVYCKLRKLEELTEFAWKGTEHCWPETEKIQEGRGCETREARQPKLVLHKHWETVERFVEQRSGLRGSKVYLLCCTWNFPFNSIYHSWTRYQLLGSGFGD